MLHGSLSRGHPYHGQCHHSVEGASSGPVLRSPIVDRAENSRSGAELGQRQNFRVIELDGGPMDLKLKTISKSGIPEAIAKAELYRYLNEPEEAESICRDVLAAEPKHMLGLRTLGLAITDQFAGGPSDRYSEVEAIFQRLAEPQARLQVPIARRAKDCWRPSGGSLRKRT